MKNIIILLTILIATKTIAQDKTYTFSKNRLLQVRKFSYDINPLRLTHKSIKVIRFDTIKTPTRQYALILEQIEKSKKDSIIELQNFKNQEIEYKKMISISDNLKLFLSSGEKFKEKKKYLEIAQFVSDSLKDRKSIETTYGGETIYDREYKSALIFSSKDFNIEFKDQFKEINKNDNALSNYYKKMISNIQYRKPIFNWKTKTFQMNYNSRDGEPKKFNITYNAKDTISVDGYEGSKFDYLNLEGTYKIVGQYYKKSNLEFLLRENVKKIDVNLNNIYEMKDDNLLQNTENKEYVVINGSFISEYETTKSDEDLKNFTIGYLAWKTQYIGLTKSAKMNINNCNSILKRNTFINALGRSVWNPDKISKKDKIDFNNNLDKITEKLNKLGSLSEERKYYNYFLDNVKENEGIDVYGLSIFQANAVKFNLE